MLKEFKEFALRGNVLDLAVGVMIGAAFGKIVSSLVADIFTPIIGVLVGGVNFTSLSVTIGEATILYGNFLQNIFDFIIIAFAIFLFVKAVNKLARKKEPEEKAAAPVPEPTKEEVLLTEIRDLLKQQQRSN